jgi:hypothetical protein
VVLEQPAALVVVIVTEKLPELLYVTLGEFELEVFGVPL